MKKAWTSPSRCADGGMTLIEILIAMAIFSLISVMSVQAIGQLSGQAGIWKGREDDQQETLTALRLLESDLQRAATQFETPLPVDWIGRRINESEEVFQIGNAQWRLAGQRLSRMEGATQIVFRASFNRLTLQIFQQGQAKPLESLDLRLLPQAAEIVLETPQTSGGIRRLVALGSARL